MCAMRIFLIGMPGSGKSYWMEQLSRHWHLESLDLDTYIEASEGKTIHELFEKGEAIFREKEHQALQRVISTFPQDIIIATGGGVPFFFDNMQQMMDNGRVLYLEAGVDYLFRRLLKARRERPLLQDSDPAGMHRKLETLFMQRKDIYEQAHHCIAIEDATLATFAAVLHS